MKGLGRGVLAPDLLHLLSLREAGYSKARILGKGRERMATALRVYRHLLLGDSCRYALLDLRASFWRQSRISNKYFCDSPTRGFSVLANRAYSM